MRKLVEKSKNCIENVRNFFKKIFRGVWMGRRKKDDRLIYKQTVRLDKELNIKFNELRDYLRDFDTKRFKNDSSVLRYAIEELHERIFGGSAYDSGETMENVRIDKTTAENLYTLRKMTGFTEPVILNLAVGKYLGKLIEDEIGKSEYLKKQFGKRK